MSIQETNSQGSHKHINNVIHAEVSVFVC